MYTPHRNARFRVRKLTILIDEWAWQRLSPHYNLKLAAYRKMFFKLCNRYLQ